MTFPIDTSVPPSDRLGHSEYVPSQIERAAIEAFIPSAKSALDELEHELQAMQHRRDEAASLVANAESALAPIRVLPTEMLQEIFMWACAGETHKMVLPTSSYEKPDTCLQWRLIRVCRRWRAAVIAQPRLWNTIAVGCHDWISGRDFESEEEDEMASRSYTTEEMDNAFDHMSTVLRYSSQAALNMTIEYTILEDLPAPKSDSVNRLLELVFNSSPRWKTASLTMTGDYPLAPLTTLRNNLPRLENLSVSIDPYISFPFASEVTAEEQLAIQNLFSNTPQLKNITFYDSFTDLDLPWEQIKAFRGAMCVQSYDGFFHSLLKQCLNLETFHAPVFCRSADPHNPTAPPGSMLPIVQTSLTDVYLAQPEHTDLLTLPKLHTLTVAFGQEIADQSDGIEEQCTAVRSLLARSDCMPSCLTISQYFRDFMETCLQDLFADEHFAKLTTLCVLGVPPHYSNVTDPHEDVHDIFEHLAQPRSGKLALPNLQVLEINFMTSFDGFDLEAFMPPNIGPLTTFSYLEKMISLRTGHLREIRLLFNMPKRLEFFPWTYDICDAVSEETIKELPSVLRGLRKFKGSVKIELTMKYSFRKRLPHRKVVIDLTSIPIPSLKLLT